MVGAKGVAAGVHVDLERQRLLRAESSGETHQSKEAGSRTTSDPKPSRSSSSVGLRSAVSAVAGVCLVAAVCIVSLSSTGFGPGSTGSLSRLGDLLDAGFGRPLTPDELKTKTETERAAASLSEKALDEAFAFEDDVPSLEFQAKQRSRLGSANEIETEVESVLPDRLGTAALGANGLALDVRIGGDNTPVLPMTGKHDLTHVAAKLGAWGDCPRAFRQPTVGPRDDWSSSYQQVLQLADTIYVLCVRCEDFTVPAKLAKNTLLVDGKVFDECDQADRYGLDHYKRASLSHAAAMADALNKNLNKVAVVEEDSVTPKFNTDEHGGAPLGEVDLFAFAQALKGDDWSFARLGWRQYTLEINPESSCPQQCACQMVGAKLCFVAGSGCDLRSSDSYIVSERYFKWTLDQLIQGGTVDYDVLPRAPGTLLSLPILSAQRTLDIPVEHQQAVSELFMSKCLTGEVPDFSKQPNIQTSLKTKQMAENKVGMVVWTPVVTNLGEVPDQVEVVLDGAAAEVSVSADPLQAAVQEALRPEERARAMSLIAQERIA